MIPTKSFNAVMHNHFAYLVRGHGPWVANIGSATMARPCYWLVLELTPKGVALPFLSQRVWLTCYRTMMG